MENRKENINSIENDDGCRVRKKKDYTEKNIMMSRGRISARHFCTLDTEFGN